MKQINLDPEKGISIEDDYKIFTIGSDFINLNIKENCPDNIKKDMRELMSAFAKFFGCDISKGSQSYEALDKIYPIEKGD